MFVLRREDLGIRVLGLRNGVLLGVLLRALESSLDLVAELSDSLTLALELFVERVDLLALGFEVRVVLDGLLVQTLLGVMQVVSEAIEPAVNREWRRSKVRVGREPIGCQKSGSRRRGWRSCEGAGKGSASMLVMLSRRGDSHRHIKHSSLCASLSLLQ